MFTARAADHAFQSRKFLQRFALSSAPVSYDDRHLAKSRRRPSIAITESKGFIQAMGQRREGRKILQVPVRIFGTDSRGKPFSEHVSTLNISQTGVLLSGVQADLNAGETVGLSYGPNKARFSVKWIGRPGTPQAHQVGLLNITTEKPVWDFPLPAPTIDPHGRDVPRGERRMSPRLKCMNSVELHPEEQGSPIWGKVVELGMGGCFIEMPIPLRQGAKLKMGLWIQESKIWMRAKVVSSRPGFGIGLQFTEIAPPDKEALRAFLRGISNLRIPGL